MHGTHQICSCCAQMAHQDLHHNHSFTCPLTRSTLRQLHISHQSASPTDASRSPVRTWLVSLQITWPRLLIPTHCITHLCYVTHTHFTEEATHPPICLSLFNLLRLAHSITAPMVLTTMCCPHSCSSLPVLLTLAPYTWLSRLMAWLMPHTYGHSPSGVLTTTGPHVDCSFLVDWAPRSLLIHPWHQPTHCCYLPMHSPYQSGTMFIRAAGLDYNPAGESPLAISCVVILHSRKKYVDS